MRPRAEGAHDRDSAPDDSADRTDPRWRESVAPLVELIRAEIQAAPDGRVTFARFMQRALTEPGLGYYVTSAERPTRRGDFLTAPELHPLFGRCIARQLTSIWRRLGEPARFGVREWGAGRGTLARSVVAGLIADVSPLKDAIVWQPVDVPGRHAPASGPVTGVILANEYLDALPVHRVLMEHGVLLERYVAWQDGWFTTIDASPSTPTLATYLAADGVTLGEGQQAEICLAAPRWLALAAATLERGVVLIIDYGHPATTLFGPQRRAGSLVTYREHVAGDDPFLAIGHQDLTAHVDITALERAAAEAGLDHLGTSSQAELLLGLGITTLLSDVGRDPATHPQDYLDARSAVARMLDPRHLGAFRVLAFGRDVQALPPILSTPSTSDATEVAG